MTVAEVAQYFKDHDLETVSRLSMERHRDQVYDLVIITAMGKLIGAVTIKEKLSKELKWRGHSPLFM